MNIQVAKNKTTGNAEPVATHSDAVMVGSGANKKSLTEVLNMIADDEDIRSLFTDEEEVTPVVEESGGGKVIDP